MTPERPPSRCTGRRARPTEQQRRPGASRAAGPTQSTGSRQGGRLVPGGLRCPPFKALSPVSRETLGPRQNSKISHTSLRVKSPSPAQFGKQPCQLLRPDPGRLPRDGGAGYCSCGGPCRRHGWRPLVLRHLPQTRGVVRAPHAVTRHSTRSSPLARDRQGRRGPTSRGENQASPHTAPR